VVTPLVMAFSGWGARLSVDAKRARAAGAPEPPVHAWPLSLLALLLGFAFFSSGLPKLRAWADFDLTTQGARSWLVSGWYDLDRTKLLAPYFMGVSNAVFWEVTDLVAVAFELGVLLSLVRRGLFRGFLFIAVMFHFSNLLMLNISFLGMLPVYAMFAPWERVLGRVSSRLLAALDRLASTRGMVVLLALLAPLYAWLLAGRVAVDTAMLGFSHFGVLCGAFGVTDASWTVAVALFPVAILLNLYLAGLPQGQAIAAVPLPAGAERVLFFDGVCNLCNGFVDFMITRDRRRLLRYGSLQSDIGTAVDDASASPGAPRVGSMVLVDADRRVYRSSDAALKAVTVLGGPWRVLAILFLVPRPLREIVYRLIARYRYKLFGKKDTCRLPTKEERALFVS
jgi:predicted DCC family thiol-disulfide oxidoreductase YuxK